MGTSVIGRRHFIGVLAAGGAGRVFTKAVQPLQDVPPAKDTSWLIDLPKIELHLHLEGATPRNALWDLVTKYGGDPLIRTREDLDRALVYRDFKGFLRMWVWMLGYLREYDDFTLISRAAVQDLARQNIRYVESFFSPPDFRRSALSPQRVVEAIRAGLRSVPEIEVALIADLVRDRGVDHAQGLLERIAEVREQGIVGIGIGGSESEFPPEMFEAVYERARAIGFRTTAHAGEAAGAPSVWGAIRDSRRRKTRISCAISQKILLSTNWTQRGWYTVLPATR